MEYHLVVVRDFGAHKRGDVITDEAVVEKYLSGDFEGYVVKVLAPHPAVKVN